MRNVAVVVVNGHICDAGEAAENRTPPQLVSCNSSHVRPSAVGQWRERPGSDVLATSHLDTFVHAEYVQTQSVIPTTRGLYVFSESPT